MPFYTPSLAQTHETMLKDIINQDSAANIAPDSDFYLRAMSVSSAVEGLYTHQQWIVKQIFPDTADPDFLEMHANIRGLSLKQATGSYGLVRFYGEIGSTVGEGIHLVNDAGVEYYTTTSGVIGDEGWCDVYVRSTDVGVKTNTENAELIIKTASTTLTSALALEIIGGVDDETHDELLSRLLEVIRRPAAGGNKYDYKRWALEVPGVTQAYVFPLRRGLGTVDIIILSAGKEPSVETILNVKKYIDEVRPVTAKDISVTAPVIVKIDVSVILKCDDSLKDEIKESINNYFKTLEPGQTLIKSKIDLAISKISGVKDHELGYPKNNITFQEIELCILGEVNFYDS